MSCDLSGAKRHRQYLADMAAAAEIAAASGPKLFRYRTTEGFFRHVMAPSKEDAVQAAIKDLVEYNSGTKYTEGDFERLAP